VRGVVVTKQKTPEWNITLEEVLIVSQCNERERERERREREGERGQKEKRENNCEHFVERE